MMCPPTARPGTGDHCTEGRTGWARVYLRSVGWGIATGAVSGALTGAVIGAISNLGDGSVGSRFGLAFGGAFYGVIFGTLVSILPSLVGGGVVAGVIAWRHPTSPEAVQRDLGEIFVTVVAVINAVLLVAVYAGGNGISSVARSLLLFVPANLGVALMLWRARASIGRGWLAGNR